MAARYFDLIREMKDAYNHRLRLVESARQRDLKPTARLFATTVPTVRKWLRRYQQHGPSGLQECSRAPHRQPRKTPPEVERRVVALRQQLPTFGAPFRAGALFSLQAPLGSTEVIQQWGQSRKKFVQETTVMADESIKHVVLLMMENHSFDQMLGSLQDHYPDLEGVDINSPSARFNLDRSGNKVFQIPTDEQQVPLDPKHENRFVLGQIANGNSGFVTDYQRAVKNTTPQDRQYVIGYYLLGRLPALHALACEFTVCDHWFSSLPGPTWLSLISCFAMPSAEP